MTEENTTEKLKTPSKPMDVHFSSAEVCWNTPQDFYDTLNEEFNFTLDPCCLPNSAKCETYFTPLEDGLSQSWAGHSVWVNPPYGRTMYHWIEKAYQESLQPNTKVVMLLPSRTDTQWFHNFCVEGEIRFLKGRIKFVDKEGNLSNSAPFPSMVVIFDSNPEFKPCFKTMLRNGLVL